MNKFLPQTGGHDLRLDEFMLMQQAYFDGFKALIKSYCPSGNGLLDGVDLTITASTVSWTDGFICLNFEIYKVTAGSFPLGTGTIYCKPTNIAITPSPVIYEDTQAKNVHFKREIIIKYQDVSDTDGIAYDDLDFPGGVIQGTIEAWLPPSGKNVNQFFDSTGLGFGVAKGRAICNGLNGTQDLRGFYLPMVTTAFFGTAPLSPLLNGTTITEFQTLGENLTTLTEAQLPIINMSGSGPGNKFHDAKHSHSIEGYGGSSGPRDYLAVDSGFPEPRADKTTSLEFSGITIDNIGGGQTHNNRPASFGVYYIQRIR